MMLRLVDGVTTSLVVMSTCLRLNLASVLMTLRLGVTTLGVGIAVFSEHVLFAIALKALKNVKYKYAVNGTCPQAPVRTRTYLNHFLSSILSINRFPRLRFFYNFVFFERHSCDELNLMLSIKSR